MVQRKIEKTASLCIAAFIIIAAFIPVSDWSAVSLHSNSSVLARCVYPFFHASFLHAVLNAWCFLSAVFLYDVSWRSLALAWIIAAIAPPFAVADTPTVGLSAVCYALFGLLLFKVRRPAFFVLCLAPYLLVGLAIPFVNGSIHIYAFLAGALLASLNAPIPCRQK